MEKSGNVDMLCPFGDGKIVLLNGLSEGEQEDEDEQDVPMQVHASEPANTNVSSPFEAAQGDADIHQPDIEDMATKLLV